jgi:hypothetical protein
MFSQGHLVCLIAVFMVAGMFAVDHASALGVGRQFFARVSVAKLGDSSFRESIIVANHSPDIQPATLRNRYSDCSSGYFRSRTNNGLPFELSFVSRYSFAAQMAIWVRLDIDARKDVSCPHLTGVMKCDMAQDAIAAAAAKGINAQGLNIDVSPQLATGGVPTNHYLPKSKKGEQKCNSDQPPLGDAEQFQR